MKTIDIFGEQREEKYTKYREACRAVVINNGKILLSRESKIEQYMLPGGGVENGETLEKCCIRELAEETGIKIEIGERFLTINEYYNEWLFVNHYFICKAIGEAQICLTEAEKETGLVPIWLPIDEAMEIFGSFKNFNEDSIRGGMYKREFQALKVLFE